MTEPMTPKDEGLETLIARIIDPEAWDEISADDNEEVAHIFADAWDAAQHKARIIRSLFSTPKDEGGGEGNHFLPTEKGTAQ